jgi:hypothetical protein
MPIRCSLVSCLAVLLALSASESFAGPCVQEIDRVQAGIDAKLEAQAAARRSARESTAATMHRQPTPDSIAATEVQLGEISPEQLQAAQTLMAQAREADRTGDRSACVQVLMTARRVFDF